MTFATSTLIPLNPCLCCAGDLDKIGVRAGFWHGGVCPPCFDAHRDNMPLKSTAWAAWLGRPK